MHTYTEEVSESIYTIIANVDNNFHQLARRLERNGERYKTGCRGLLFIS